MKVLCHVDDNMSRGKRKHTEEFWQAANERFGLKCWDVIEDGESRKFLGVDIMVWG